MGCQQSKVYECDPVHVSDVTVDAPQALPSLLRSASQVSTKEASSTTENSPDGTRPGEKHVSLTLSCLLAPSPYSISGNSPEEKAEGLKSPFSDVSYPFLSDDLAGEDM
mmetsp:Transcript_24962/g.44385  ORF Transcript_24962/g.44385 Transcript_24962/m.44385 type:complete len:109 (+) Transcript_24962:58-384(+)